MEPFCSAKVGAAWRISVCAPKGFEGRGLMALALDRRARGEGFEPGDCAQREACDEGRRTGIRQDVTGPDQTRLAETAGTCGVVPVCQEWRAAIGGTGPVRVDFAAETALAPVLRVAACTAFRKDGAERCVPGLRAAIPVSAWRGGWLT